MKWINEPQNPINDDSIKLPCTWVLGGIGLCLTGPLCSRLCIIHADD